MRIETLLLLAVVAFLFFKSSKAKTTETPKTSTTTTEQLPTPAQVSNGDGGAARALIEEGADLLRDVIDHVFEYASEHNTPPDTQSDTF